METRARYALIGLFMLAVIAASFAFVYWLENKGGFAQRETYQIRFQGSVSGLLIGSAVLFNGIRVGEVTDLGLNADAPQDVIATVAVVRGTPIRADTQVNIETQGLTGGAAVALRGGSSTSPLVAGEGERASHPDCPASSRARLDPSRARRLSARRPGSRRELRGAQERHHQYRHFLRRARAQLRQGRWHPGGVRAHDRGRHKPGRDSGLRSRRSHDRFAPRPRRGAGLAARRARADHAHGLQHRQNSVAAFRGRKRARPQCAMGRQRSHSRAVQGDSEL